ncbi:hypothetical protein [Paenibacillus filicis]|uniref:hypothetical protein n=1 Tax=Paenibacillus filicis TaxID=669464 RepID=UPI003BF9ADF6
MKIAKLSQVKPNSNLIDFSEAESALGFQLCSSIKSLYTRVYGCNGEGSLKSLMTIPQNNKWDTWFSFNETERDRNEFFLEMPHSSQVVNEFIIKGFLEWTGGNDFGRRMMIGNLLINIGSIPILINNDTNQVEWIDCDYGHFEVYEENPNGVFANSIDDFLKMFV